MVGGTIAVLLVTIKTNQIDLTSSILYCNLILGNDHAMMLIDPSGQPCKSDRGFDYSGKKNFDN